MQYIILFLEGIITFVSPCLLPMLPIYISYFVSGGERSTKKTLIGATGFVTGFTIIFVALGALAGTLGSLLRQHQGIVNIVSGAVVIFFGLHFLGVIKLDFFKGSSRSVETSNMGFFTAMLFGIIFSLGWTPCVGAFLGSALMLASLQAHAFVENRGYTFPVLYDTEHDAAGTYDASAMPTTFFINRDGYVVKQIVGAINEETLKEGIEGILAG